MNEIVEEIEGNLLIISEICKQIMKMKKDGSPEEHIHKMISDMEVNLNIAWYMIDKYENLQNPASVRDIATYYFRLKRKMYGAYSNYSDEYLESIITEIEKLWSEIKANIISYK